MYRPKRNSVPILLALALTAGVLAAQPTQGATLSLVSSSGAILDIAVLADDGVFLVPVIGEPLP